MSNRSPQAMSFLRERFGLEGCVAVVGGGGGGLGRAAALDLASVGVDLALCDIDPEGLSATASEARSLGAETLEMHLDVRDPEALGRFYEAVERHHRTLDVLVNVVGGTFRAPFTEVNAKGQETLVRTNFSWVADSISRAITGMRKSGRGGSIITITSIEAHRAAPGFAVYAAMKAAVTHLTRSLAVELGPSGIRVNCIAPDFVPTAGMARVASEARSAGQSTPRDQDAIDPGDALTIPLGRKGDPKDIGNCVLFLASDLSSYITGTTLHPDGGALAASGWMNWPEEGFMARPPAWVLDDLEEFGER
jgi:3-oxoacyl-[acyl-carrier protein] reductase